MGMIAPIGAKVNTAETSHAELRFLTRRHTVPRTPRVRVPETFSLGGQPVFHTNRVASALNGATFGVMGQLAIELSLVPLSWEFLTYKNRIVLEGRPRREADILAVPLWADRLGMTEYNSLGGRLPRAWYLLEGAWEVDVIAGMPMPLGDTTPVELRVRRTRIH